MHEIAEIWKTWCLYGCTIYLIYTYIVHLQTYLQARPRRQSSGPPGAGGCGGLATPSSAAVQLPAPHELQAVRVYQRWTAMQDSAQ